MQRQKAKRHAPGRSPYLPRLCPSAPRMACCTVDASFRFSPESKTATRRCARPRMSAAARPAGPPPAAGPSSDCDCRERWLAAERQRRRCRPNPKPQPCLWVLRRSQPTHRQQCSRREGRQQRGTGGSQGRRSGRCWAPRGAAWLGACLGGTGGAGCFRRLLCGRCCLQRQAGASAASESNHCRLPISKLPHVHNCWAFPDTLAAANWAAAANTPLAPLTQKAGTTGGQSLPSPRANPWRCSACVGAQLHPIREALSSVSHPAHSASPQARAVAPGVVVDRRRACIHVSGPPLHSLINRSSTAAQRVQLRRGSAQHLGLSAIAAPLS